MTEDLNKAAAYCPTCGAEYREGFDRCADDGTKLIPGPPPPEPVPAPEPFTAPETSEPMLETKWVSARSFLDGREAMLLAGRLESEGIPARAYPEPGSGYRPEVTGVMLQGTEVLVPADRLLEARQLINQLERA
ncbi:MAG: hypothetical protein ACRDH9_12355 [Actinomycetota bacterium]